MGEYDDYRPEYGEKGYPSSRLSTERRPVLQSALGAELARIFDVGECPNCGRQMVSLHHHAWCGTVGDVGKCPNCGSQSRSYARGCSSCGYGKPEDRIVARMWNAVEEVDAYATRVDKACASFCTAAGYCLASTEKCPTGRVSTTTGGSMRRREIIKARMAQLERELVELDRFPRDTFPNGTVIKFEANFNPDDVDGQKYTYAAIKVDGLWYTTGPRSPKAYSWDQLTSWMQNKVREVWLMKDGDTIVSPLNEIEGTVSEDDEIMQPGGPFGDGIK